MNVTVSFCCNDDRGNFTDRVVEIGIEDLIRLECRHERGFKLSHEERSVRVGHRRFDRSGTWQAWVGNLYWDACGMNVDEAKRLVAYLIGCGWTVTEHAESGPFASMARKRA